MSTLVIGDSSSVENIGASQPKSSGVGVAQEVELDQLAGATFVIADRPLVSLALSEADTVRRGGLSMSDGPLAVMNQIVERGVGALRWIDNILTPEALARAPRLDIAIGVPLTNLSRIDRYCEQLRQVDGLSEHAVDFVAKVEAASFELSRSASRLHQIVRHAKVGQDAAIDRGGEEANGAVDPRVQKWIDVAAMRAERGAGKLLGVFAAFQQVQTNGHFANGSGATSSD